MVRARVRGYVVAAAGAALLGAPASADSLSDLLPDLIGNLIVLDNATHAAHFQTSGAEAGASFNSDLVAQLQNHPQASSAGGFSYVFDPTLGTLTRKTQSFGPVFVERAQTIGKGKWNLGFNYNQASYDKIDDLDLTGGKLLFQAGHEDCCSPTGGTPALPFFEGDVISEQLSLKVQSKTTTFYANVGLSDRFDVALTIPVQNVELDGNVHYSIDRYSTADIPAIHRFPGGGSTSDLARSDSASGIGDVALRGKLRFKDFSAGGLAAILDVRLPTGDEKDLLGGGYTRTTLGFVASGGSERMGLHANIGYSLASGSNDVISDPSDELHYGAGLDVSVHPRVTIAGEVVGSTLYDASRAVRTTEQHVYRIGANDGPVGQVQLPLVEFQKDDLQLLLGSLAVKFNPTGNLLLTIGALWQMGSDGLQDNGVSGIVGGEYSF